MRTILIPLILICSLTQFESVQAAKKPRIKLPECNGEWDQARMNSEEFFRAHSEHPYVCFAPKICIDKDLEGKSHTEGGVARVTNDTAITIDCPAIIRYHFYEMHQLHASLESFQDLQKIKSLEFIVKVFQEENEDRKFSCNIEDGKIVGRYGKNQEYLKLYIQDELISKLKCEFDIINEKREPIFHEDSRILSFLINGVEAKTEKLDEGEFPGSFGYAGTCHPSWVYFNETNENDAWNIYEKVQHKNRYFYCNDFYELEYRKVGSSEYKKEHLSCPTRMVLIESENKKFSNVDARCTAKAKYFCDYDVKTKRGKRMPARVKPSWNPKRESSLKCPPEKPHLVIIKERYEKQIPNAKIECRNYKGDQFWTVDGEILYEEWPVVYCTDTVECNPVHMIPASSVKNGFLDRKDFLPRCYKNQTLYVDDKKVLSKECDNTDGKFKYSVGEGVKLDIDEKTKFVCK